MKITVMWSLILACCFVLSFNANAQKNLISNGGFEDGLNGWGAGNARIATFIHRSGDASVALVSYLKGKWEGIDQKVKLPKNTKAISFTGFTKTDAVEQGANPWNVAVIIVEFTSGDQKVGDGIPIVEKTGTNDWTAFKKNLKVPEGANGFRLMIALSEASGNFFADDLAAKVLSDEDFEKENSTQKTN